ncbi:MAG: hypothetical protein CME84_10175 [Henriciella sp.]|jgi:hypothetical protein|uniref:hypothetical protein n=1 Tax=Henriciella sp. TaxID=1968823 RepID=UPI000C0F781E|nr:hypothetical protein [Henriciella sp.]MAN74437.1 hypothetical protein [Henriciella sp.]MBF35178.1 hypothetical protein [Hyphomonadaceae bacterium]PHR75514.1 MAG: hypothetical protein COA64_12035 [Henriciella sp.]|tara:strand:- start:3008 stop:3223 length:216 start_codon:yes stop_codon:yes gene_type:complete
MGIEIFYFIGAVILFGVLVWAVMRSRLKSPKARAIREEAAREEYENPQQFEKDKDKLAAKAEQAENDTRRT